MLNIEMCLLKYFQSRVYLHGFVPDATIIPWLSIAAITEKGSPELVLFGENLRAKVRSEEILKKKMQSKVTMHEEALAS